MTKESGVEEKRGHFKIVMSKVGIPIKFQGKIVFINGKVIEPQIFVGAKIVRMIDERSASTAQMPK